MRRYLKSESWVEEKYEGEIKDGKRHGRGVMKYANRSEYDGQWKDGKRHGRGVFEYANGGRTDGEWKDVTGSGRGVFVWTRNSNWAGDKYEGEYKDGKKHGRGVFRFSNGNVCNGNWRNNSLRGMGEALRQGRRSRCYEDDNTIKFVD